MVPARAKELDNLFCILKLKLFFILAVNKFNSNSQPYNRAYQPADNTKQIETACIEQ